MDFQCKDKPRRNELLKIVQIEFETKQYLNFDLSFEKIKIILKYRARNHQLEAEVGCYHRRKDYEERLCIFCTQKKVENLYHFMIECPMYVNLRKEIFPLLNECVSETEFYEIMNTIMILCFLLKCDVIFNSDVIGTNEEIFQNCL